MSSMRFETFFEKLMQLNHALKLASARFTDDSATLIPSSVGICYFIDFNYLSTHCISLWTLTSASYTRQVQGSKNWGWNSSCDFSNSYLLGSTTQTALAFFWSGTIMVWLACPWNLFPQKWLALSQLHLYSKSHTRITSAVVNVVTLNAIIPNCLIYYLICSRINEIAIIFTENIYRMKECLKQMRIYSHNLIT